MLGASRPVSRRLARVALQPQRCFSISAVCRIEDNLLNRLDRSAQPPLESMDRGTETLHDDTNQRKVALSKQDGIYFRRVYEPNPSIKTSRTLASGALNYKLDSLWLRDHCRCSKCVNQDTMQKTFDTFSLPQHDPGKVIGNQEFLRVQWRDGHISEYQWDWLDTNTKPHFNLPLSMQNNSSWGSEIASNPPSVHYDEIMASDAGVGTWTNKIHQFGFCFVDGCPVSPEKTEELLKRIAHIRVTHYGGFYDFTSDLSMKDTAYTSQALPAHTDNAYFTEPSGLQMFHLLSHTEGTGGASLLVDGLRCMQVLRKADESAYELLLNFRVRWHASGNEGIIISSAKSSPILSRKPFMIRWNNDDRATLRNKGGMAPKLADWYEAARKLDAIIKDQKSEYWEQLTPGRPLIFDNWRILHGRSAFTGKRRICGGYINHDDYMSRYLTTNFTRDKVLSEIL